MSIKPRLRNVVVVGGSCKTPLNGLVEIRYSVTTRRLAPVDQGVDMRNVLISGASIAGPTLAYWLRYAGFR